VVCVAVLPDGNFVSGSYDTTVRIWNTLTGETIRTFPGNTKNVNCVAVLPNRHIVSGSEDGTLRIWSYLPKKTGKAMKTLQLAMGKNEIGRTFNSPNFGIAANKNASILHKMPKDPRMLIGSYLGLPANTRTNPERKANRALGKSNYNIKMEQLQSSYNSNKGIKYQRTSRRKTRKSARKTSRRSRQNA
jgi:hypothetical protein